MEQQPVTDMTMLAKATFNNILTEIQDSCLNYTMQLTPYSAAISLRKSLVTDRNGEAVLPIKVQENIVNTEDIKCERDFQELENKYRDAVKDLKKAVDKIKCLEETLKECDETISVFKTDVYNDYEGEVKNWKKYIVEINRRHLYLQKILEWFTADYTTFEPEEAASQNIISCFEPKAESAFESSPEELCTISANQISKLNLTSENFDNSARNLIFVNSEPVSRFQNYEIPSSLASHWLHPPEKLQMTISSISSLRSHYVTHYPLGNADILKKEEEAGHRNLFDEYNEEFIQTCKQS